MQTSPYFQLDQTGVVLGDPAPAAAEFAATRAIVCRGALDATLLARLDRICDAATFRSDHVHQLGHRRIEDPPIAGKTFQLLLRQQPLFRWLENVTGCRPVADIDGRVVQTHAEPGDELDWHNDVEPRRLLAVTVALTSPPFVGGGFELRRVGTENLLVDYRPDRPGTMLIFEVSRDYEHRVLPVSDGGPRRVFTGWFLSA